MTSYSDFLPTRLFQLTVAISADGARVAYSDNASGQFNAVVQPAGGGDEERLTDYVDQAVRRVAFLPDGSGLVYSADTKGDEFTQLYRLPFGGSPQVLTPTPKVRHFLAEDPFSPDGRLLAFTANDRSEVDQDVLVRDLENGDVRRVLEADGDFAAGAWTPDGAALTVLELLGNTELRPSLLRLDGGKPELLLDTVAKHQPVGFNAAGDLLYLMTDQDRDFTALYGLSMADRSLSVVDAPDWDVENAVLSADRRVLVWDVNEDGRSRLRARDVLSGQDIPVPEMPAGVISSMALSADGSRLAVLFSTATRPMNVAVVDFGAGEFRWLTDAAPTAADPAALIEPELIRYPTHDGREIPAYLYRPAGDGPFGVVLSIHGGPEAQERANYNYGGFYQYLVSRGIGVLAPNVRGSTGYGTSYQKLIHRDWGGDELKDFDFAVRYLHSLDWVDGGRIGVFGGSFGGFATLSCVSRLPDLWAAAVSVVGPSNLVTFAKAVPPTWRRHMADWVGDPYTEVEFLTERSPLTYADQIVAPLMVIQGANDPRVVQAESDQIVASLRERGVQVRYDVYADEGHGFTKRENTIKAFTDSGDFLVGHLGRS